MFHLEAFAEGRSFAARTGLYPLELLDGVQHGQEGAEQVTRVLSAGAYHLNRGRGGGGPSVSASRYYRAGGDGCDGKRGGLGVREGGFAGEERGRVDLGSKKYVC